MITWTRSELKEEAKSGLYRNYWKSVLAGILLTIALGTGGIVSYSINLPLTLKRLSDSGSFSYQIDSEWPDSDNYWDDDWDFGGNHLPYGEYGSYSSGEHGIRSVGERGSHSGAASGVRTDYSLSDMYYFGFFGMLLGIITFIAVIITAIAIACDILLLNPLEAGVNRFMLINLRRSADIKEVGYAFDRNYKNTISTMFFRDLYIFLWSLLFVIPGIVKAYEYRMIPYLLTDHPGMSRTEAFARSKAMMNGQKWNTFVLDLSFIGWDLLSAVTFGLVGLFYVIPYQAMTNAALYERLRGAITYQQQNGWNPQNPGGWNPTMQNRTTPALGNERPADSAPTPSDGSVPSSIGENPAINSENDNTTTTANP